MTERIADLASEIYYDHKTMAYGFHHNERQLNNLFMRQHENQLSAIQDVVQRFDDDHLAGEVKSLKSVSKATSEAIEAHIINAREVVAARLDEFREYAIGLAALKGLEIIVKKPAPRKQLASVDGVQDSLLD